MDWTDFASSSGGFNRTDPALSTSLTFSAPLTSQITSWPSERDEFRKRLHKAQKDATPFAYDTTPRVGIAAGGGEGQRERERGVDEKGRVYVEEAWVDCWADLMMGGGWMEREELTFKEANWALVRVYSCRVCRR
jgi:hypothetical protein